MLFCDNLCHFFTSFCARCIAFKAFTSFGFSLNFLIAANLSDTIEPISMVCNHHNWNNLFTN